MLKREFLKNSIIYTATAILAIFIGSNLPTIIKKIKGPFKEDDYSMHIAQQPYRLTLYGTTTCPHCMAARKYLHRSGIPFNDRVIDKSKEANEAFKQLKENAVPVLVSKNRLIVGFDPKIYTELNRIANQ